MEQVLPGRIQYGYMEWNTAERQSTHQKPSASGVLCRSPLFIQLKPHYQGEFKRRRTGRRPRRVAPRRHSRSCSSCVNPGPALPAPSCPRASAGITGSGVLGAAASTPCCGSASTSAATAVH
eukprot:scaffold128434_cov75-Phaeocystis_antarctica.AAC.1